MSGVDTDFTIDKLVGNRRKRPDRAQFPYFPNWSG